jgi:hypothetical protein
MNKERKLIIAGNWKMNKTVAEALDLVRGLKLELANVKEVDIVVCPPFTALESVSKAILDSNIRLGAQNMSEHNFGAFTGEIAPGCSRNFPCATSFSATPSGASIRRNPTRSLPRRRGGPCGVAQADCLRRRNAGRTRRRPDGKGFGNPGARQPRRVDQGTDG